MAKTYLGKLGVAPCVMPIGPVAYWWDTDEYKHWDLPEHWHYVEWRERLADALVEAGFLTYRHWSAFKGTWNNDFQDINNIVLSRAHFVIDMTPEFAWSEGRDEEMEFLRQAGRDKEVIYAPPPARKEEFTWRIKEIIEELRSRLEA